MSTTDFSNDLADSSSETASEQILNIAAYKFVRLDDLEALRTSLKDHCRDWELRGTILLSTEGINLFLAGRPSAVEKFVSFLRGREEFADLEVKRSFSSKVPFRRMLVRLKKEIIPCGVEQIVPERETSPKLPAQELKRWLDEGRSFRLLDVRNTYEVELGTFEGAEQLDIGHFREFQAKVNEYDEAAKDEPIVMFCTGGIRCEKAGPIMENAGFDNVYQLDGGILKYFEECGGEHYDGSCFVFDGRVAVDNQLKPTGNLLCFACQAVLTADDVKSGRFMFGKYCPRCFQDPKAQERSAFEKRQQLIRDVAQSQPGSTPYDHVRKIHVPGKFAGWKLIDFLDEWQPAIGRVQWNEWIEAGNIRNHATCNADTHVKEGERFYQTMPDTVEPEINPDIELLYEDESLVVINKPAPLPCHPSGRFNRNTLVSILAPAYPNQKLRLTHRLDANTSGIVLLCRKYRPARIVQPQFAKQTIEKEYVVRVSGHPDWEEKICAASISAGPTANAGGRDIDDEGLPAKTVFQVIHRFDDATTLLSAKPKTGRTHQIRVHLWHLGHPVQGDPLYLADGASGLTKTLQASAPEMQLFSQSLTLDHPDSGERVRFEAELPDWAKQN